MKMKKILMAYKYAIVLNLMTRLFSIGLGGYSIVSLICRLNQANQIKEIFVLCFLYSVSVFMWKLADAYKHKMQILEEMVLSLPQNWRTFQNRRTIA